MTQRNFSPGRGPGYLTGFLMIFFGLLTLAITFGVIPTDPSNINAPGWVLALFGGIFMLAGLWVIMLRTVRQAAAGLNWMSRLFGLLILGAVSVICLWIGFGPGQRVFVNTDSLTGMRTSLLTDPTLGRIFFGGFGLLLGAGTIAIAFIQGRKLL